MTIGLIFKKLALMAIMLCICLTPLRADVLGEYYVSPDRIEVLLIFPERNESYYFYNNSERLCYTFKLPGSWLPGRATGLLRSKDGQAEAGVLIIPEKDLEEFEGSDLVARAVKLITQIHSDLLAKGKLPEQTKVVPHESNKWPGTKKWTATWIVKKNEEEHELQARKLFVQVHPKWVAQITVLGSSDDESMANELLGTLSVTDDPQCYWPFIHEHFPIQLEEK